MGKRDLSKCIEALLQTVENIKEQITKLEEQRKDAATFQFVKKLCEKNLLFFEDQKVNENELADVLMMNDKQIDPMQTDYPLEKLKRRLQSCYSLIDELQEIQARNN